MIQNIIPYGYPTTTDKPVSETPIFLQQAYHVSEDQMSC